MLRNLLDSLLNLASRPKKAAVEAPKEIVPMTQITKDQYQMGRMAKYGSEWTQENETNCADLLPRVNKLLAAYGKEIPLHPTYKSPVSSGWRPPAINAQTPGAAPKSNHVIGKAVDLYDPAGDLDNWCKNNLNVLESLGLWLESPDATNGWCHLDTKVRANRIFKP